MSNKKQNMRKMLAIALIASLVTSMGANETALVLAAKANQDSSVVNNQTKEKDKKVDTFISEVNPDAALEETFTCVTNPTGTINQIEDGYLHIKSGSNNGNNNADTANGASAIFTSELQNDLDFNTDGYVEFDFKSPQSGSQNRFGIFLGHKNFRRGLFIGFDSLNWFWQKYGDQQPYGTITKSNIPEANREYHLKLSWNGTVLVVELDGQKLGEVNYADFKSQMSGKFALSCGTYGTQYTDMYIRNLHYSTQETITAYDVSGTVKDDNNNALSGVNIKIDGKVVATTDAQGAYTVRGLLPKEEQYTLSFEKDGYTTQTKTVTIAESDITLEEITLSEIQIQKHTIATKEMSVEVDQNFPRVIKYTLGDKSINGQTSILNKIVINGVEITPQVTSEAQKSKVVYTMTCQGVNIDAVITAEIRVNKNNLTFEITNVENRLDNEQHPVQTINIPEHSLVSVSSDNENAKMAGADVNTNTKSNGDKFENITADRSVGSQRYFYAFVSNGELSAGIDSNSEFGDAGAAADNRRVTVTTQDKGGVKHVGLSSSEWYYDRKVSTKITQDLTVQEKVIPHLENPKVSVSITADKNGDGTADWQDAAIALRDIMHNPFGSEEVPELVAYRIAMNFGGQAQNTFLKTLDNVKKISTHTDGLGQSILLKGYGNEGHDSGHPDYADIGKRIGGAEDMNFMMEEGAKLGARFGIHVNASEMYTEAKSFSEELARRNNNGGLNYGWTWLDQGIGINGLYDLMSGGRTQRFKDLEKKVGQRLNFVYVDVWGNNQSGREDAWETRRLTDDIVSNGWRIAHEWGYANEYDSTFQHWAADLTYGGAGSKGINSRIMRFLRNHQKDSWIADYPSYGGHANAPLLGGYNMKDFEGWQGRNDYDSYVKNLFAQNVSTKFVQHFTVSNWELGRQTQLPTGESFQTDKSVTLNGDLGELRITRGSDEYSTETNSQYRYREMQLNGITVLKGHLTPGDGSGQGDETYLLPWVWDAKTGEKVQESKEKLYHWNTQGGQTTWELPENWRNLSTVKVYKLTDTGRTEEKSVNVQNGSITLTAEAQTPYVVVRGNNSTSNISWSDGTGMVDVGFNSGSLEQYKKTGSGKAVIQKTEASNPVLKLDGEVGMTQEITGLKPGKKYAFYVGVDNRSDSKAIVTIKDGKKVLGENYTNRSIAKNYIQADAHNTNSPTIERTSYFQNMYVYFVAPNSGKVTVTLSKEAGDGSAYFDDLRVVENGSIDDFVYENGKVVKYTQDFEDNAQGVYPFVISDIQGVQDNRPHLSEKNAPFTQKGWDVKKLDDVIDDSTATGVATGENANWSLKTMGLTGSNKMVYHTIPQNFRFEPNVTYDISFDYQSGSEGIYAFAYGSGEYHQNEFTKIPLESTLPANARETGETASTKRVKFTIVGDKSGDTWFGIYSTGTAPDVQGSGDKESNFGGYKDIVIDNVVIEVSKVQKGELLELIKEAKSKYEEDYPQDQFNNLISALERAEAVANNQDATEQEVKTATQELKNAIDALTAITTSIKGVVTNVDGQVVENAKLTLTSDKGEKIEITTEKDGSYKKDNIFVRDYSVRVEARGYETIYSDRVQTVQNQSTTKNITLQYKVMPDYFNEFTSTDTSYLQDLPGIGGSNLKSIEDGKLKLTFSGGRNDYGRTTGVTVDTNAPVIKNGLIEFDVTPNGDPTRFGLALRAKNMNDYIFVGLGDSPNQYFVEFWNGQHNKWSVMFDGPKMEAGKQTHFKVLIEDRKISLWVDGVSVINNLTLNENVQLTKGQIGFECRNGGASFTIDNLEVTSHDVVENSNTVSGIVTAGGQPVYNVELNLVPKAVANNTKASNTISARTNLKGEYTFKNVPYGEYTLTVASSDYQQIAVPVNVVEGEPIVLDIINLVVDKSALESLIRDIEVLDKSKYTKDSWAKLEEALKIAKDVVANQNATAEELQSAINALTQAKENLVLKDDSKPDKSGLESAIKDVQSLDKSKYTKDSWAKLEEALKIAKDVANNKNATQEEINNAIQSLRTAIDGLVAQDGTINGDKPENNPGDNNSGDNSNGSNNGNSSNTNNKGNGNIAQTGDNAKGLLAGIIATALAGVGATILAIFKKKKKD